MLIDRHKEIMKLLNEEHVVKVQQLAEVFDVSIETIRRDLKYLEGESLLKRIHGGAILENTSNREPSYEQRQVKNVQEKKAIGQLTARLIENGDTLAICGGTSTIEAVKCLKEKNNLTILTNSLLVANIIGENQTNQVFLAGGRLNLQHFGTEGQMVCQFLSNFRADKAIISAAGISIEFGATDYRELDCMVMQEMVRISRKVILLMDYTKLGRTTLWKICNIDRVHTVVTDENAPAKEVRALREAGIQVYVADKEEFDGLKALSGAGKEEE